MEIAGFVVWLNHAGPAVPNSDLRTSLMRNKARFNGVVHKWRRGQKPGDTFVVSVYPSQEIE